MKRTELKEFIEAKTQDINNLKKEDSEVVVNIVNECLNELLLIEDAEFRLETNTAIFIKSREILKNQILIELESLKNKEDSYLSNNFFQIKMTLKNIIDCLNVHQD